MNTLRTTLLLLSCCLLWACGGQTSKESRSQLKGSEISLIDRNAGKITSLAIWPDTDGAPGACFVRGSGELVCHGPEAMQGTYQAFRTLGKLRLMDRYCAVNDKGYIACLHDVDNPRKSAPRQDDEVQAFASFNFDENCALIESSGGIKCYSPEVPLGSFVLKKGQALAGNVENRIKSFSLFRMPEIGSKEICALYTSGLVKCKAFTYLSEAIVADFDDTGRDVLRSEKPFVQVVASQSQTCALDEAGAIACFAPGTRAPLDLPPEIKGQGVVDLTGGGDTLCARYSDGDFSCWGAAITPRKRFKSFKAAIKVGASSDGICAVFADESMRCLNPKNNTLRIYNELLADSLIASGNQSCSVGASGELACFGEKSGFSLPPHLAFPTGREIAMGRAHLCYIDNGRVHCQGATNKTQDAVPLLTSDYAVELSAAADHSCALTSEGKVLCWGDNSSGQTDVPANLPQAKRIQTGSKLSCAISTSGQLQCWGASSLKVPLNPPSLVEEIAIGDDHACVLDQDRMPFCWGDSSEGKTIPAVRVAGFQTLVAGPNHTCAIDQGGFLQCWGRDDKGQAMVPKEFMEARALALGAQHTCATNKNNKVGCWGLYVASDVKSALESAVPELKYAGEILRHSPLDKDLKICANGQCQVPSTPVVSFKGLGLPSAAVEQTYSLWVDYKTSQCSSQVRLLLNGQLEPDFDEPINGNRRKARFYNLSEAEKATWVADRQGHLEGPVFLQLRTSLHGYYRDAVNPECEFSLERITVVPTDRTTEGWKDHALELAEDLDDAREHLETSKLTNELVAGSYLNSAKILHKAAQRDLVRVTKQAIVRAYSDGYEIEGLPSVGALEDTISALIYLPVDLPLFGANEQTEMYPTLQLRSERDDAPEAERMPPWFVALKDMEVAESFALIQTQNNYRNSIAILRAPVDASNSITKLQRLAHTLARGPLDKAVKQSKYFMGTTALVRSMLDESYKQLLKDAKADTDDQKATLEDSHGKAFDALKKITQFEKDGTVLDIYQASVQTLNNPAQAQ